MKLEKFCRKCGKKVERIEKGRGKAFFEHPEVEYFRPCGHPTYSGIFFKKPEEQKNEETDFDGDGSVESFEIEGMEVALVADTLKVTFFVKGKNFKYQYGLKDNVFWEIGGNKVSLSYLLNGQKFLVAYPKKMLSYLIGKFGGDGDVAQR